LKGVTEMIKYSLAITVDKENLIYVMICLIIGVMFASIYTIFIKKMRGEFVMALIDAGAFDEESSKTPSELGIKMGTFRKMFLKKSSAFSPDFFIVNGDTPRYYVKEDSIDKLTSKYGNSGITIIQLFLTLVAFLAIALVMVTAVPEILNMFNF
jgi:hypothetical protein